VGSETGFLTKILRVIPKIIQETRFLQILMKAINFSFITKFWGGAPRSGSLRERLINTFHIKMLVSNILDIIVL